MNGYKYIRIAEAEEWKTAFRLKIRLIRAFGMPPLKRGHRHVAGNDSVNRELS
jgi:hypothetical protein